MTNPDEGRILEPFLDKEGHPSVILDHPLFGKRKKRVCDLMALTFIGKPEPGQVVMHRDGDKLNNAAANLYYGASAKTG